MTPFKTTPKYPLSRTSKRLFTRNFAAPNLAKIAFDLLMILDSLFFPVAIANDQNNMTLLSLTIRTGEVNG